MDWLKISGDLIAAHAEIERLQELLRGVGANRYWEGRWRDERERCAKIARLEGARAAMTDDPCAVPLERMAQRIEVAIRRGGGDGRRAGA